MRIYENPDFQKLPPDLLNLFAHASETSFFLQAAWFDLIMRKAREPGSDVRVYADERPAAALVCRTDGYRRLHGFSNVYSLEYAPIAGERSSEGMAAILRLTSELASMSPRLEFVQLAGLDAEAPSFAALQDGFRSAHWMVKPVVDAGEWFEETDGLDFRDYLESRPGVIRNTFRRKAKLAKQHKLDYVFSGDGADIEELIADYETVYQNAWQNAERFPFMPDLIRFSAAVGALRMGVLRVDGVPAAAQFWLIWRRRAVIYKLAYDGRFSDLSPGTLLTMRMIERVLENDKPVEINFGRGDHDYKRLWLPKRRGRWKLCAANPLTLNGAYRSARMAASSVRDRARAFRADHFGTAAG